MTLVCTLNQALALTGAILFGFFMCVGFIWLVSPDSVRQRITGAVLLPVSVFLFSIFFVALLTYRCA